MKAAILAQLGETPRYAECDPPDARPGETIVDVRAASIKQLDRAIAGSRSKPRGSSAPGG